MGTQQNPYNCGCITLGGWDRRQPHPNTLIKYETEIKNVVQQAKNGWYKIIIATVLKEQNYVRKLLRKYGFKKTPEALSKYNPKNTQCIYYWDSNALKPRKAKNEQPNY